MRRADAILLGVAWGAASTVIAYACIRALERAIFVEPNPAMLIWADRSPFFWRAAIALYIGGAAVFAGFAIARRSGEGAARGLLALVATAAVAIVAQGTFLP